MNGEAILLTPSQSPNPTTCRQELNTLFDPDALILFCFDCYPGVYDRFRPDQTPTQRLNQLIAAAGQVLPPAGGELEGGPAAAPIFRLPHPCNPNFTGRQDLLTQLEARLHSGHLAADYATLAGRRSAMKHRT